MKLSRTLYYVILAALVVTFLACAIYVGAYILNSRSERVRYDELSALVDQHRPEEPVPAAPTEPDAAAPAEPEMLPEYAALYALNSDVVGWLEIPGTRVNYPVMQTPESRDYYLRRNFDRKKDSHGSLYAREECDINGPSDNITIYGHNMKNGSMFAGLNKFLKKSYWEEHRTLTFDTLYEHHSYDIFAVFRTSANVGEGFPYHAMIDAAGEADFREFIENCRKLSLYDTGIVPEYGDKVICLSTCEYSLNNGRLVVAAVRRD